LRREYPDHPIVGVGAVILEGGKILLVKRGASPGKGKWSIPGGVVEVGENVREAVIRETREESGLNVRIIMDEPMDALDSIKIDEDGRVKYHFIILPFLVKVEGGELKPADDVIEARWVPLKEVDKYNLTESFRNFFRKHRKKLKKLSEKQTQK